MFALARFVGCSLLLCVFLWGCGSRQVIMPPELPERDLSLTKRKIDESELRMQSAKDPDLSPSVCCEILARINIKDRSYISKDIAKGNTLNVPNSFSAYKGWSPLPARIPRVAHVRKFILLVKDIPFLGWYGKGKLTGDTQVCIGKKNEWTKAGLYSVLEKDAGHISQSYRSALGYPALMPFALRIYGRVWIHGGDVTGGYCSHGCINLPLDTSEVLFNWADKGTMVLVVDSLKTLEPTLNKHASRLGRAPGS